MGKIIQSLTALLVAAGVAAADGVGKGIDNESTRNSGSNSNSSGQIQDFTEVIRDWWPDSLRVKGIVVPGEDTYNSILKDVQYVNRYTLHNYNVPFYISADEVARIKNNNLVWLDRGNNIYGWQVCRGKKTPQSQPSQPKPPVPVPPETLTQVIKQIVEIQPVIKPTVSDTPLVIPIQIKPTVSDTPLTEPVKIKPSEESVFTPVVIPELEKNKGLYDLENPNIGVTAFYRNDRERNQECVGINPSIAFNTCGKGLRGKLVIDPVFLIDLNTDENKWIGSALVGVYNKYIGGGFEVDGDNGNKAYLYPYLEAALPLGQVTLAGRGGVGFDFGGNNLRHFLEGILAYNAQNKDKFNAAIRARSGHDNLLDKYMNEAGVEFGFGPLILGISGKTPYGIEIADAQVLDALKSIETKYAVGARFGDWPKFCLKGYVSGKHNDAAGRYETVEAGGGAYINF